jgi:integrase
MGLTRRKDGWYVEFPVLDDGKTLTLARGVRGARIKRWKTGTANRTLAKQQEAIIKTDLMKGIVKSDQVQGPMTFKALADAYLVMPGLKRQTSFRWKEVTLKSRFLSVFGETVIDAITPAMIEAYREERRTQKGLEGTTVKVATINRELALLKHMFNFALRERWLQSNPVTQVKLEKENNVRDRVLEPDEFERLQAHSASHLQTINVMAYETGMRSGEILHMTWDRVDMKAALIRLRAEDTKTDEPRVIPLTVTLTDRLKDLYKVRYLHEPHVFLLDGKSVQSVKTAFKAACRRAGIKGFRFHDFRHTAVTNMRRAGIDHLTIMRITGHKTLEVFKRYNSFLEDDLKDAAHRFNTYLTRAHQEGNADSQKSLTN